MQRGVKHGWRSGDLFDHLKPAIAKLTRSNLHRCLQHHGISRIPEEIRPKKKHGKFRSYEIGYLHIDITEFYLDGRKWYLFVGIDRVCKCAYVELHERMTQKIACSFSEEFYQRLLV